MNTGLTNVCKPFLPFPLILPSHKSIQPQFLAPFCVILSEERKLESPTVERMLEVSGRSMLRGCPGHRMGFSVATLIGNFGSEVSTTRQWDVDASRQQRAQANSSLSILRSAVLISLREDRWRIEFFASVLFTKGFEWVLLGGPVAKSFVLARTWPQGNREWLSGILFSWINCSSHRVLLTQINPHLEDRENSSTSPHLLTLPILLCIASVVERVC